MLSKYGKCDNRITNEYRISNGMGRERIVTGNKKGNILGNCTGRQIGQRAHRLVALQDRQREMKKGSTYYKQTANAWTRSDSRVQGDRMSRS